MANMLFANNANTTLASSLTNSATTMSVTSASAFPSPTGSQYFYCTLADAATQTTIEIVKVTAVSGTTFTIVRGQDGTTGTIFASGAVVSLRLVRASLQDFPLLDENNTFTYAPTFNTALSVGSGGTGVTASSGANSVVLRDSNQNVYANNFIPNTTTTVASSTPVNLNVASAQYQIVTGSVTSQVFNLPDATTLTVGDTFYFNNNITYSSVQINAHDGSTSLLSLQAGGVAQVILLTNSTSNGTWDVHSYVPSSVSWGTATLSFNTASSISGSVSWLGNTVGVAHGGTGLTSLTAGYIPFGNGTGAFSSSSALYFDGTNLGIGAAASGGKLEVTGSGTVNLKVTSTSGNAQLILKSFGTYDGYINYGQGGAGGLVFYDSNAATERMHLFSSGGVSIGNTTDPGASNLSVSGFLNAANFTPTSSLIPTTGMYYSATNQLGFSTNSALRMTIDNGGYVGVNCVAARQFQVQGAGSMFTNTGGAFEILVGDNNFAYFGLYTPASPTYFAIRTGTTAIASFFNSSGVSIGNTVDKGAGSLNVSGLIFPQQATTASAPAYQKGAIYFDTTLNKLRVGGATAWETITSI